MCSLPAANFCLMLMLCILTVNMRLSLASLPFVKHLAASLPPLLAAAAAWLCFLRRCCHHVPHLDAALAGQGFVQLPQSRLLLRRHLQAFARMRRDAGL